MKNLYLQCIRYISKVYNAARRLNERIKKDYPAIYYLNAAFLTLDGFALLHGKPEIIPYIHLLPTTIGAIIEVDRRSKYRVFPHIEPPSKEHK